MTPEIHEYRQARRKISATRAVETRRKRRDIRLEQLAETIIKGESLGPFPRCRLCGRPPLRASRNRACNRLRMSWGDN
jgi:hypothetical protein